MSVYPPGDTRNDNSPPGIQWMSDPSDTEKIARLERDLLAANLHAVAVKAERDLWKARCKEAQRLLGRFMLLNYDGWKKEDIDARDAGKDE